MVELDHIFICVSEGAPEGDALAAWGWTEGPSNIHHDLGSANRRFYANNFMLELLFVRDEAALRGEAAASLALHDRLTAPRASRFGVCLRCEAPDEPLPFATMPRQFAFLPDHITARIPDDALESDKPLTFCLSDIARPELYPKEVRPPLEHAFGGRKVTGVRLSLAPPGPGASLALCAGAGLLELAVAPESLLELWFDGADGANRTDFTGHGLPLVVYCQ